MKGVMGKLGRYFNWQVERKGNPEEEKGGNNNTEDV